MTVPMPTPIKNKHLPAIQPDTVSGSVRRFLGWLARERKTAYSFCRKVLKMSRINILASPDAAAATLTKAVVRAAQLMGISQQSLARILGVSAATTSRMFAGRYLLSKERGKEWEIAVLFVRMYRSLDAIFGHADTAIQWLNGNNVGLSATPIDLIQSTEGLVRVLHYLDAHRGRV